MADIAPSKSKNRKALSVISSNELNVSAGKKSSSFAKSTENKFLSPEKSMKNKADDLKERSLADELKEVKRKLKHLRIEKEKTEELLKERDVIIKSKEEELENRAKEQEKLQKEIKKLQNLKEFNPAMNFPIVKSLREKEQEKNKKLKKPSSAYILWTKEQWSEVKTENPEADFKEMTSILGAKWKILSAEDKKPYEEKYQQEKMIYVQIAGTENREAEALILLDEEQKQKTAMELLEQYLQFKQEADNEEGKKPKKEKDPLKPKKPMSAFFLLVNKRRPNLLEEKKNILEISKIAGEEWKNMTEEEKAPYEQNAEQQKEEYNKQMEMKLPTKRRKRWNRRNISKRKLFSYLKGKREPIISSRKRRRIRRNRRGRRNLILTSQRSQLLLFFFSVCSKEMKKELAKEKPDIGNSTLTAMISVKWKELSDEEKKANEGMTVYKRVMEEYNKSIALNHEAAVSEE